MYVIPYVEICWWSYFIHLYPSVDGNYCTLALSEYLDYINIVYYRCYKILNLCKIPVLEEEAFGDFVFKHRLLNRIGNCCEWNDSCAERSRHHGGITYINERWIVRALFGSNIIIMKSSKNRVKNITGKQLPYGFTLN